MEEKSYRILRKSFSFRYSLDVIKYLEKAFDTVINNVTVFWIILTLLKWRHFQLFVDQAPIHFFLISK